MAEPEAALLNGVRWTACKIALFVVLFEDYFGQHNTAHVLLWFCLQHWAPR